MGRLSPQNEQLMRVDWETTSMSNSELARKYDVDEKVVRNRGKNWGPRNAAAIKRARVNNAAAIKETPGESPKVRGSDIIQGAADQDIQVMLEASQLFREALERCRAQIKQDDWPPRDLKCIVEAGRIALDGYRRARNLDEPAPPPPESSPLEALAHSLAQARKERS